MSVNYNTNSFLETGLEQTLAPWPSFDLETCDAQPSQPMSHDLSLGLENGHLNFNNNQPSTIEAQDNSFFNNSFDFDLFNTITLNNSNNLLSSQQISEGAVTRSKAANNNLSHSAPRSSIIGLTLAVTPAESTGPSKLNSPSGADVRTENPSLCQGTVSRRFRPPKGPRKQHRTGFRQLPGANGVVKKGRPSKNAYKSAGINIDMYNFKGVILKGPVSSLDEVETDLSAVKLAKRVRKRNAQVKQKSISNESEANLDSNASTSDYSTMMPSTSALGEPPRMDFPFQFNAIQPDEGLLQTQEDFNRAYHPEPQMAQTFFPQEQYPGLQLILPQPTDEFRHTPFATPEILLNCDQLGGPFDQTYQPSSFQSSELLPSLSTDSSSFVEQAFYPLSHAPNNGINVDGSQQLDYQPIQQSGNPFFDPFNSLQNRQLYDSPSCQNQPMYDPAVQLFPF